MHIGLYLTQSPLCTGSTQTRRYRRQHEAEIVTGTSLRPGSENPINARGREPSSRNQSVENFARNKYTGCKSKQQTQWCADDYRTNTKKLGSNRWTHRSIYYFWSSWYLRRLAIPNKVAPPKTMKKMTEPNVKSIPSDIIHLSFRPKWRLPTTGLTGPRLRHKCRCTWR